MRGVIALACAAVFVESIFFGVLGPVLPDLRDDFNLSATQVGVLAGGYAAGMLVAALPAMFVCARWGLRAMMIGGLLLLAAAGVSFGFTGHYELALAEWLIAGIAGAMIWMSALVWVIESAVAERRGAVLGAVLSATAAGGLMGPVVGAAAVAVGRAAAFTGAGVLAAGIAVFALGVSAPAVARRSLSISAAWRSRAFRTGTVINALPGALIGVMFALGPLQLRDAGASAGMIACVFLIPALIGIVCQPLVGHWSDRVGRLLPVQIGVLVSVPLFAVLAVVENRWLISATIVAMLLTIRCVWGPVLALLSDACDHAAIDQLMGFAWGLIGVNVGIVAGSAGSGAATDVLGRPWTFAALSAALCIVLALMTRLPVAPAPALRSASAT